MQTTQTYTVEPVYKKFLFWNRIVGYNILVKGSILFQNFSEDTAKHICDALNEALNNKK